MTLQTRLSTTDFVREYLALLDEGWTPDLEEYLMRIPEGMREDVFRGIDMALAERETRAPAGVARHVQEYAMMLADGRAPEPLEYLAEVREEIRDAVKAGIRVLLEEQAGHSSHVGEPAQDESPAADPDSRVRTAAAEMAAWFARSLQEASQAAVPEQPAEEIQAGLDAALGDAVETAGIEVGDAGEAEPEAAASAATESGTEVAAEEAGVEVGSDAEAHGIDLRAAPLEAVDSPRRETAGIDLPADGTEETVESEAEIAGIEVGGLDVGDLEELSGELAIPLDDELAQATGTLDEVAETGAAMCEAVDCTSFETAGAEPAPTLDEVGDAFAPERAAVDADAPAEEPASEPASAPEDAEGVPTLAGYRIADTLGPATYAAWDEATERRVVVKIAGPHAARKVLAAAEPAGALGDADCVAFHTVVEGEAAALVADFVEGTPLDDAAAGLDWRDRARVLLRAARVLARAHAAGVAHLGLKPANVIVTPGLEVRIVDWGTWTRGLERKHGGLPVFAAPEQLRKGKGGAVTDVYGFGATMYAVLTGGAPVSAPDAETLHERVCRGEPELPRTVRADVPADLESVCLACLSREPHRRPSMAAVVADLQRFLDGEPVQLRPRLYTDVLLRCSRQHVTAIEELVKGGLVRRDDADRLGEAYRRVVECETTRPSNPPLSLRQGALFVAAVLAAADAWLYVGLAATAAGPFWSWLAPALLAAAFAGGSVAYRLRGDPVRSAACQLGVLATVPPALHAAATVFGFAPPLLAGTGSALLLSGAFLAYSRFTVFAWTTAGAAAVAWMAASSVVDALAVVGLVPLALLLPVGALFEGRGRGTWAQPFHLLGLAALLFAPILLMAEGVGLGVAPHVDRIFGLLALHGAVFAGAATVMRRFGSLDLRLVARVLEPVASLYLLGVLAWNAHAAGTAPAFGLLGFAAVFLALLRGRMALFAPVAAGTALLLVLATAF